MGKGIFAVYTGNGKGKTTASLGLVFRALGHGKNVAVIQFIKSLNNCGEHRFAEKQSEQLTFYVTGKGFTWKSENLKEDKRLAEKGWEKAKKILFEGNTDLIVLDELTYLIQYGMVDENEIIQTIQSRPDHVHVVITGRNASDNLIAEADLVTEMKEIKHPYHEGVPAQKGFDF